MTKAHNFGRVGAKQAGRSVWIVMIITLGTCFSPFFACATPFAALATVAALKLGRADAVASVGLVWLANQSIGYGFLHYPWTWDSAAWGLAIGASSILAIFVARGLSSDHRVPLAVSLPFIGSFAAFELGLYMAGVVLPGSDAAFTASVVEHVFLINAVALCGVLVVHQLAILTGLVSRNEDPDLMTNQAVSFR